MMFHSKPRSLALMISAGLAVSANAQPELNLNGETIDSTVAATNRFVPDVPGSIFRFTLLGADGGDARTRRNGNCFNAGGQGGTVTIDIPVLRGVGNHLRPRQVIRAIIGRRGGDGEELKPNAQVGAGGGGGTGLITTNGTDFSGAFPILAVAGGGGGAYSSSVYGICTAPNQEGGDAETASGDGSSGERRGGGSHREDGSGSAGGSTGGLGGMGVDEGPTDAGDGGFGYGGGAGGSRTAAGGGGGYSGGNGGGQGGSNFINADYHLGPGGPVNERTSPGAVDGLITFEVVGQIHDARSNALTIDPTGTLILGSTLGATASPDISCSTGMASSLGDVFYQYTNSESTTRTLQITRNSTVGLAEILNSNGVCLDFAASTGGAASVNVAPGGTVYVRIGSASQSFAVPYSIASMTPSDADGDGIPNDQDVCPGLDDTIVPSLDTNGNGNSDFCDGSVIFNKITDLGIIGQSGSFAAKTETTPNLEAVPFVYDAEGTLLGVGREIVPGSTPGSSLYTFNTQLGPGVYYLGVTAPENNPADSFQLGLGNPVGDPREFTLFLDAASASTTVTEVDPLPLKSARYFRFELTQGPMCTQLDMANPISVLDVADVRALVNRIESGVLTPETDLDGDGVADVFDLIGALKIFDEGC